MTNADKIRSMTDEELADFLNNSYVRVKNGNPVFSCVFNDNETDIDLRDMDEWLKSEVSE